MKARIKILVVCQALLILVSCSVPGEDQEIKDAIARQMENYPASTLIDIYKSFFQDEFGPGHLLEDTAAAWQYFIWELDNMESSERYDVEPCGAGKNFIRVPMDLVKDSLVSPETYFHAFLGSSSEFNIPELDAWEEKWSEILHVVIELEPDLPGFEEDKKQIDALLESGQAMVHHSERYRELYDPHYRIMTPEQWEKIQDNR